MRDHVSAELHHHVHLQHNITYQFASHVSKTKAAAAVGEGQALVIDPQQVQDGRM
jgi:hypothetical protein